MTRADRHRWQEPDRLAPVIIIASALVAAVLFWPYGKKPQEEPASEEVPVVKQEDLKQQQQTEQMQIQYPVPQPMEQPDGADAQSMPEIQPLSILDRSYGDIEQKLRLLLHEQKLGELFLPQNFIPNFVVTIDNMTGSRLPRKFSIVHPLAGQYQTIKDTTGVILVDQRNYSRYTHFIDLLDAVDISRVVSFYVSHYDLFQQAYRELGYPDRYFNDRLVQVLDHLLMAPEVSAPVRLVRAKAAYQFADPELEALSAGHKLLIRMGPDNAARIKARVRDLRQALTTLQSEK